MGYSTYHSISCENKESDNYLTPEMVTFLTQTSGYGERYFNGCDSAKWHDCDDDMILLSERFRDITFRVDGHGDTPGDVWVNWFCNGARIGSWYAPNIIVPSGFEPPEGA